VPTRPRPMTLTLSNTGSSSFRIPGTESVTITRVEPADRERLLDLVRAHATNPLSFLVHYGAAWEAFLTDAGGAPLLIDGRVVLMWADPLGDARDVLRAFTVRMRRDRKAVALIAVARETAIVARSLGYSVLKVGEEPWFDLAAWVRPSGDRGKRLRWCVNRAQREDVAVEEYDVGARDEGVEQEIGVVLERWELSLRRPVVTTFLAASPLSAIDQKRIFCARVGRRLVGFLACSPVYARGGWYLEDLVRAPDAPMGTTELLVVQALRALGESGGGSAALGIVPLRNPRDQLDARARWLSIAIHSAVRAFDRRYSFRSLDRYETKFAPSSWEPRYVAFLPALPRPHVIRAAIRTL